jgi:hypothetical protein
MVYFCLSHRGNGSRKGVCWRLAVGEFPCCLRYIRSLLCLFYKLGNTVVACRGCKRKSVISLPQYQVRCAKISCDLNASAPWRQHEVKRGRKLGFRVPRQR